MAREILVNWTTAGGGGFVSVLNFADEATAGAQRTALNGFLLEALEVCANTTSFEIATEGREFDETTGTLTGFWTDPTVYVGAGIAGNQAADATQALVRWRTLSIVGGRLLQGRTFIPGIGSSEVTAGNLNTGAQGTLNAAAEVLVSAGVGFSVWSRPITGGRAGSLSLVTEATVWSELAVLRRRRD